jgi:hypothetical protein
MKTDIDWYSCKLTPLPNGDRLAVGQLSDGALMIHVPGGPTSNPLAFRLRGEEWEIRVVGRQMVRRILQATEDADAFACEYQRKTTPITTPPKGWEWSVSHCGDLRLLKTGTAISVEMPDAATCPAYETVIAEFKAREKRKAKK